MFNLASEETYQDGQVIIREGSSGDWVYVVLAGAVEISKTVGERRYVIETLQSGEIFGELGFLGGIKRTATARALGETTLGIIDRTALDMEFNKLSKDFRTILTSIVKRFKKMIDRSSSFSSRKEARSAATLSVMFKDRESFLKAYTGNISSGGLFVSTDYPLKEGERILLKLQLPEIQEPLEINCEVAWTRGRSPAGVDAPPPGMGVRFCDMAEASRRALDHYLEEALNA